MNAITPHQPGAKPPAQTPELRNYLAIRLNRMDPTGHYRRGALPKSLAPTEGQRRYLENRKAVLLAAQAPDPNATRDALTGILLPYMPADADPDWVKAVYQTYMIACAEVPGWCMTEAHKAFAKGHTPGIPTWKDKQFRPSPANVLAQAMSYTLQFDIELHQLSMVLEAEIEEYEPDDEAKQKALAYYYDLLRPVMKTNDVTSTNKPTPEEAAKAEVDYAREQTPEELAAAAEEYERELARAQAEKATRKQQAAQQPKPLRPNDGAFGEPFTGDED